MIRTTFITERINIFEILFVYFSNEIMQENKIVFLPRDHISDLEPYGISASSSGHM